MNGTKITELATLRPLRGLRLTSYSSFNFRHLWLHFTYCLNMRSSYPRYIWSSLVEIDKMLFLVTRVTTTSFPGYEVGVTKNTKYDGRSRRVFGLFILVYLLEYCKIGRNKCKSMKEQLYYGAKYTLCYLCILYYGEY